MAEAGLQKWTRRGVPAQKGLDMAPRSGDDEVEHRAEETSGVAGGTDFRRSSPAAERGPMGGGAISRPLGSSLSVRVSFTGRKATPMNLSMATPACPTQTPRVDDPAQ